MKHHYKQTQQRDLLKQLSFRLFVLLFYLMILNLFKKRKMNKSRAT
jgi:hypothetical protein